MPALAATKKPTIMNAAALWRDGSDTAEIAKHLGTTEAQIWSRLDDIKAAARRMRG